VRIRSLRSASITLTLVVVAMLWLVFFWLSYGAVNQDLVGTWSATFDHPASDAGCYDAVLLVLDEDGTFLLKESACLGKSNNRSTSQTSGRWDTRDVTLRLIMVEDYWNVLESIEHQILEVGDAQMVLQQDGVRFEFQRRAENIQLLPARSW